MKSFFTNNTVLWFFRPFCVPSIKFSCVHKTTVVSVIAIAMLPQIVVGFQTNLSLFLYIMQNYLNTINDNVLRLDSIEITV